MVELDYLVVGHVTRDLKEEDTFTVGGTVSYAARTARALGCRVGVITSASFDLDLSQALDGVLVACLPASTTTTFENVYTSDGRRQVLHGVAEMLSPAMALPDWRATIVHLGPVAQECDPALASAFGDAFIGVTPQGWMRCWDRDGRVRRCRWESAREVLARADAVVLSEEDVAGDRSLVAEYAAQARLLAVTQGAAGCTVYMDGQARHVPAPKVQGVDPTGAGDVFAVAFFVWSQRGRDPQTAARFANCVAACSVTRAGLSGAPNSEEISRCERTSRG
jgi:sugar/nucleoside kinase (ribokinase family)